MNQSLMNAGYNSQNDAYDKRIAQLERQYVDAMKRIYKLEQQVEYQALEMQKLRCTEPMVIHLKGQAAQQQATEHLYAPLRSDTRAVIDLAAFARRLIDMQDLGHAVTDEVRELAKRALGLK